MHNVELIFTLTAALTASLLLGWVAFRLKLPPLVGYLLAGLLIGPHTPGFVANRELAEQLAEFGVVLLLFDVGLHFHVEDLIAVRKIAVLGAMSRIVLTTGLTAWVLHTFGWSWSGGMVYGVALSVASTVVLTRILEESRELQTDIGKIAIGWLVVEDIFTVFVLVLLPAIFGGGEVELGKLPAIIGIAALKMAVLAALVLKAGTKALPWLLTVAARTRSRELFTLTVLVIVLGLSVAAAKIFGVSMALGAFLAGMVVGSSEFSFRSASEALPMRDTFAVIYFVSVGMLVNPGGVLTNFQLIGVSVLIVVVFKTIAAMSAFLLLGLGSRVGARVSTALAQIGEFSFILGVLGTSAGVLPEEALNAIVATSIISIILNPLLYRAIPNVERSLAKKRRAEAVVEPSPDSEAANLERRPAAVIIGYGPVGEMITRLLREDHIEPVIVELNIDTARGIAKHGIKTVHGDAVKPEVLQEAGVAHAKIMALTMPESAQSTEIIKLARVMNPELYIVARARFAAGVTEMQAAGADQVFSSEAEVAKAMLESYLKTSGATAEHVASEREKASHHLYGHTT